MYPTDGVPLCVATGEQNAPAIVGDGSGGAIATWFDFRGGSYTDIYARAVDASGVPQWTIDGVPVCSAPDFQWSPTITTDGAGGAIVTWADYRSGTAYEVYAQRVDASGLPQWMLDGVIMSTAPGDQSTPIVVSDGAGGAIAVWWDFRNGFDVDLYADRVTAAGFVPVGLSGFTIE